MEEDNFKDANECSLICLPLTWLMAFGSFGVPFLVSPEYTNGYIIIVMSMYAGLSNLMVLIYDQEFKNKCINPKHYIIRNLYKKFTEKLQTLWLFTHIVVIYSY